MDNSGKKVAIVDFGTGNLFSVSRACSHVGMEVFVTSDKSAIPDVDALILPGVGAFRSAMENIHALGLDKAIIDFSKSGKPILGICLGMQLLMSSSEEFGTTRGLNIIEGTCEKFPEEYASELIKVPHIGWNGIWPDEGKDFGNSILNNIANEELMYFVHSYYVQPETKDYVLCKTEYQKFTFCSGLKKDNVFAFQFHPEKSAHKGLLIYENFKNIVDTWVS